MAETADTVLDLPIGGTLIWYSVMCPRQVWFLSRRIVPDQEHDTLLMGRQVHAESYRQQRREVLIDNTIRIDVVPGEGIVAEVKKSSRFLPAAQLQLAYYLWYLKHKKGVATQGVLLVPLEKRRIDVELTPEVEAQVEAAIRTVQRIVALPQPPPLARLPWCSGCAYATLCWGDLPPEQAEAGPPAARAATARRKGEQRQR
jgi:CRISPR-associated exonuclease Cas4